MKGSRWLALVATGALGWLVYTLSSGTPSPAHDGDGATYAPPSPSPPPPKAPEAEVRAAPEPSAEGPLEGKAAEDEDQEDLDAPGEGLSLAGLRRRKAFLAEPRKSAWADAEQARLTAELERLPVQSGHFAEAECRASLCKLTFVFDQEAALPENQTLFDDLRRMFGMDLASERHTLSAGGQRVTLYVEGRNP